MRKLLPMTLVLLGLAGACSAGGEAEVAAPVERLEEQGPNQDEKRESPGRATTPKADRTRAPAEDGDGDDPVGEGEGEAAADGSEDAGVFNDGESEDDHSSALHPAAGRYVYRQRGYERFCQAATCDEQPLPSRQPMVVSIGRPGVVVTEIRSSDNRLVRTTTAYSRRNALVTDVYLRFAYEAFTFENSYQPRPPVESLRFPLRDGERWSGRWEDSTSGDYSATVIGRDGVEVNGAAIEAYKIATVTNFRGEFTGSSKGILWVDPATKTVVKTSGKVDVRSSFGRYVSEFDNVLRSGPGYR